MTNLSILFAGVGGEGVVTTGAVLGDTLTRKGIKVVMSEVHGMAQRGGIVTVEMKVGACNSPIIGIGKADIIVGFEPIETYRVLNKGNKDTKIIMNSSRIVPFTVSVGESEYPDFDKIVENIKKYFNSLYIIDAESLAIKAGNSIVENIVLLGALTALNIIPVNKEDVMESIKTAFSNKRYESMNITAFGLGYNFIKAH
ncbi:MAG: indolepyruvate oxidoreductase subunit beta [Thermoplasmata archaeon]